MIFSVNAPENLMLACDETFRQVAAVAFSPFGFEARLLDEQPPEFSAILVDSPPALDTPPFEGPWVCSLPTGKINAASMAFTLQLNNSDFRETRRMIREIKKKDLVLPPRIKKWPESRLAEVARHAEHWFEKRVRPSGN